VFIQQLCVFFAGLFAGYFFTSTVAPVAVGLAWITLFSITSAKSSLNAKVLAVFLFAFGLLGSGAWWIYLGIWDPQNNSWISAAALVGFVLVLHSAIYTAVFVVAHALLNTILKSFNRKNLITFSCIHLALVIVWPMAEFLRSIWFWAFPWMFIGYSQIDNPLLIGLYPIVGVYGVSFAAIFLYWIAYLFLSQVYVSLRSRTSVFANQKAARYALLLGTTSTAFGITTQIEWTLPLDDQRLYVKVLHTKLPNRAKYLPENQALALQSLLTEAITTDVDLAVFPEFFIAKPVENLSKTYTASLLTALNNNDKTLMFGIPLITRPQQDTSSSYNAIVQLNRLQEPAIYAKEILVPFTEYMPWNPLIRWAYPFIFKYPLAENVSGLGNDYKNELINGVQLSPSICYEIAFPYHGAQRSYAAHALVNLSSDSWIQSDAYFKQTHQMARVRAAEAQKPLLRSNNVGISAIIGPRGEVLSVEAFQENTLVNFITPRQGFTPFSKALKKLFDEFGNDLYP
jgi:apolipoprotein N-acyltransferase